MNTRICFGLLLLSLGTACAAEETVSWQSCVAEAAKNNPDLEAYRHAVTHSEALKNGSYSTFLPQITASAGYDHSYDEVEGGGGSFGGSASNSYSDQYNAGLALQQTLFDGFKTQGNIAQAKAELNLAVANYVSEKAMVSYELKSAYAQLLYAQELVQISADIVERRELNYRLVSLRYDSGKEDIGALELSRSNLTQAQIDLGEAERNLLLSSRQLATVLGRSRKSGMLRGEGSLLTPVLRPEPEYDQLALKTPAHFQKSADADAAAAGISIARSDFFPTVNGNASVSRQGSEWPPKQDGWSVGVSASWSVFDGGQTYFNVRAARAALQQSLSVLRSTDDQTALSLAQDYKSLVDTIEQVRAQEELLAAKELRVRIADEEYSNNLLSFQDFDTITNDLISQQRETLAARRDAVIAEAAWEQSRGVGAIP